MSTADVCGQIVKRVYDFSTSQCLHRASEYHGPSTANTISRKAHRYTELSANFNKLCGRPPQYAPPRASVDSGWWQDTSKCGAGRICGADRHWSVLVTWLVRILSPFPAVCIQHSATPILTLTLSLILTLTIQTWTSCTGTCTCTSCTCTWWHSTCSGVTDQLGALW